MGKKNKWVWKNYTWLVIIILYCLLWFFIPADNIDEKNMYAKVLMLVIVIIAAKEDRRWSELWKKVLWVIGTLFLQAIFQIPFVGIITLLSSSNVLLSSILILTMNALSAIPVLIISMRYSELFVKPIEPQINKPLPHLSDWGS